MKISECFDTPALQLRRFTAAELDAAFEAVSNKHDWRRAIDAVVPDNLVAVTSDSIEYFTGTISHVVPLGNGTSRVISSGYHEAQVC